MKKTAWCMAAALLLLAGCVPGGSSDDPTPADAAADGAEPEADVALSTDADPLADASDDAGPGPDMAPDMGPEGDMALTVDMAPPEGDMAVLDPDMAVLDPDMAVLEPDMALPEPDMAVLDPDMALPDPDMALPDPDMALPDPDMALPDPDMALPDPDMAPPDPDMALPECPAGQHMCPDGCAPDDDPATCGDRCAPCPGAANARATCVDGACGLACDPGFEPCAEGCCATCGVLDLGSALGGDLAVVDTTDRPNGFSPSCQPRNGSDAAVRWAAPVAGTYVFTTDGSAFDTVLAVFDGDCAGPELACDDDDGEGLRSRIELDLRAGQPVVIVLDGYDDRAGPIRLSIRLASPEACANGADDDLDGDTDCDDPDCADDPACAPDTELACADGRDDDRDGDTDCDDPDCADDPACAPDTELDCMDGLDDDRDGAVDCADADCAGHRACLAERCRAPGGCDAAECASHPVCCADEDLRMAVGTDIAAADNTVGDRAPRYEGVCGGLGPFTPERTFAWTAPADGYYLFDTTHRLRYSTSRTLDSVLYVLDGCAGESRICNSDAVVGADGSRVGRQVAAGHTVLVVVDAQQNLADGDFLLSVTPGGPQSLTCADWNGDGEVDCDGFGACPACDCISDDIGLMVEPDVARGAIDRASLRRGSCGGPGPERVIRWTAPRDGEYTFTAHPDSADDDPLLYLLAGACDAAELACADDGEGNEASITRRVAAGESLLLVVDSWAAGDRFVLDVTVADERGRCGDGRDNDGDFAWDCDDPDCADDPICACAPLDAGSALGPAVARGNTAGQGHRFTPSCGGRRATDATVRWTAPAAGAYVFEADADFNHSVAVLDGACDGAELGCRANGDVEVELAEGQAVTVVIDGLTGREFYAGTFALNVWTGDEAGRCEDGLDDDGDGRIDCADPDCDAAPACGGFCLGEDLGGALGEAVFEGDLAEASDDYRPRCLPWFFTDDRDMGYRWTAPYAGRFQIDTLGSAARTNLVVLDGDCLGEQMACAHWAVTRRQSRLEVDLDAGQSIVIVVDIAQSNPVETGFRVNIAPSEYGLCDNGQDDDGDGLGDCEDPDCARDRICLVACADVDLGSATGERVLEMRTDDATDDFETACSVGDHDEVAVLWTAPATDSYRVSTAWSDISTSLAIAESCAGPELACNVDAHWSNAYSGMDLHVDAGDSLLFLIEVRQLGEGEFTLNIE